MRQVFLSNRKAAFCHRYGIQDETAIVDAVESLVQQRGKRASKLEARNLSKLIRMSTWRISSASLAFGCCIAGLAFVSELSDAYWK